MKTCNILILCTGNSARSVLAEAILARKGAPRFKTFSAGSFPKGEVHPLTLEHLQSKGYDVSSYRSKSWDEFARPDTPVMDFVITVCDNAAGEVCPIWPGAPISAHWGFEDPAAVEGPEAPAAFARAYDQIEACVDQLLALPLDDLDHDALGEEIRKIGADQRG